MAILLFSKVKDNLFFLTILLLSTSLFSTVVKIFDDLLNKLILSIEVSITENLLITLLTSWARLIGCYELLK